MTAAAIFRAHHYYNEHVFPSFHKLPDRQRCRDDLSLLSLHGDDPKGVRNTLMSWLILVIAGLFETGWAIGLKYTEGFSRLWPSVFTVLAMVISFWLLAFAMKSLPVGTAYGVWVGIGAVGTVILGIFLFNEPVNTARLISVGLIILGIIGLKLSATP